jgi:hypothetical protein
MSSRFIKNSRLGNQKSSYDWISFGVKPDSKKEIEEREEYRNTLISEKERIEAIPLEQLSFRDLYQFPFHEAAYGSWVYDKNSNFIFQFMFTNEETQKEVIDILNGDKTPKKQIGFEHKDGMIYFKDEEFILIRGWGNLTGSGAYNLDGEWAGKIQDTLAEYIVEKLNN